MRYWRIVMIWKKSREDPGRGCFVKVTPANWDELYEALKARMLDRKVEIDYSRLPEFPPTIPIDEIVSAQPMTVPTPGVWRWVEGKGSFWVDKKQD